MAQRTAPTACPDAAQDAVLKQVQVAPWLAESGVVLEKLDKVRRRNAFMRISANQALGSISKNKRTGGC